MANKLTLWDDVRNIKCDVRIYKSWKLAGPSDLEDIIPWQPDHKELAKFVREVDDLHHGIDLLGSVRLRLESEKFIIRGYLDNMFDLWYQPEFEFSSYKKPFRIEVKSANPTTKIDS